jgi:hypothetical protein
MRRWLLVVAGVVVSALFLYAGFAGLDLAQIWAIIQTIEIGWVILAAAVFFNRRLHHHLALVLPAPPGAGYFPRPAFSAGHRRLHGQQHLPLPHRGGGPRLPA